MRDTIFLNGMKFYCYHGALPAENEIGQIFIVDVTMKVDLSLAGETDQVTDTVHYGEVYEDVKSIMESKPVNLVEHLAERIAKRINSHYNRVMETKVRITKENPDRKSTRLNSSHELKSRMPSSA